MNRKKTGVRYLNVQYNVNPVKRVVACHLTFGLSLYRFPHIEMLKDNDEFIKEFKIEHWQINDDIYEPHIVTEIVAFAYCNPNDKFDENLGKKIALTRAQQAAFGTAAYIYERAQDCLAKAINDICIKYDNCVESFAKCNNHVDELIENTYKN